MKNIILLLCSLTILSCKSKTEKPSEGIDKGKFEVFLQKNQQDFSQYNKIMIIPGSGCTSCITEAEDYYTKNYSDSSTLFIFTAIGDVKVLRMKFSDQIEKSNTLVDKEDALVELGFKSIYPSIAEINDDDEIVKISTFSK